MRVTPMIALLIAGTSLFAAPAGEQQRIQEMIQEVKTAPEGERHQKMNRFKEMVRSMNQAQRSEAIEALGQAMERTPDAAADGMTQSRQQVRTRTEEGRGEMTRTQTRERQQMHEMQGEQMHQQMQQQMRQQAEQKSRQQMMNPAERTPTPRTPRGPGQQ